MSSKNPNELMELFKAIQNLSDAIINISHAKSVEDFFESSPTENTQVLENLLVSFQNAIQEIVFELMYYKYKDLALIRSSAKSYISDIIDGKVEYDRQRLNSYGHNSLILGETLMKVNQIMPDYSQIILRAL